MFPVLKGKPKADGFGKPIHSGYLYKKGEQRLIRPGILFDISWKKRYIILRDNKNIDYYENNSLKVVYGTIKLNELKPDNIIKSDNIVRDKEFKYGFTIKTPERDWHFCINKENIRDEWMNNIKKLITPKPVITNQFKSAQNLITDLLGAFDDDDGEDIFNDDDIKSNRNNNNNSNQETRHRGSTYKSLKDKVLQKKMERKRDSMSHDNNIILNDSEQMRQMQKKQQHIHDGLMKGKQKVAQMDSMVNDTGEELVIQRNKLLNVDKTLHETEEKLNYTNKQLEQMKSWSVAIKDVLGFKRKDINQEIDHETYQEPKMKTNNNNSNNNGNNIKIKQWNSNDSSNNVFCDDYEEEYNEDLDDILQGVNQLNYKTKMINEELGYQDNILDSIDQRLDRVDPKIRAQNKKMKEIR